MTPSSSEFIANQLNLSKKQIENTLRLLEDGGTVAFIARYRKELTGSLNELNIAEIQKQHKKLTELEKRKQFILDNIEAQGKLSPDLKRKIGSTMDPSVLEDLYLPFKKKRKTRAGVAKENGLEALAGKIYSQKDHDLANMTRKFFNERVTNHEDALQGARDIIAEWINEQEKSRQKMRWLFRKKANIKSKVAKGKEAQAIKYKDYFDFEEALNRCPSHRLLAIRRGEEEGLLKLSIGPPAEEALWQLEKLHLKSRGPASEQVAIALADSYKRLLGPSIETEFRAISKNKADEEAIRVFSNNLRQLLLAAPLGEQRILALDPGFRTGCKVVCLNENGDLQYHSTIFPHPPQKEFKAAQLHLQKLVEKYHIDAIAIGNGTAGRETHKFCQSISFNRPVQLFMVNESGASVYSASKIAREEFPDKDLTVRGAVSIGRRLMDPLAELVKIDPKSIGVGQYQHDVNQSLLKESLKSVVESCVNSVGININTASQHLLTYVSGLGPSLAGNIVAYRSKMGHFQSRLQLLQVPRMGSKAFEQCAGFLRIKEASNPLDNTAVHPESYSIVDQMARDLDCRVSQLIKQKELRQKIKLQNYLSEKVGLPTLKDIMAELEKPGLDPRGEARPFEFDKQVKSIEDLREGMILPGIVTNITNFGAFIDIGIKQGGLVHISQIADRFIKNPSDHLQLQQEVRVKVLQIDRARNRVTLTMKPSELN